MYIKGIKLKNYRNFNNFEMKFQDGLNVIIGSNNSGKTGLLYAIKLLNSPAEINIDDFNKNNLSKYTELYLDKPPFIELEYEIEHKIEEDNTSDESIIKLLPFLGMDKIQESRQEIAGKVEYLIFATIKAVYTLDIKYLDEYKKEVKEANNYDEFFRILNRFVEKHYSWEYRNGDTDTKTDQKKVIDIFDIRFIEAERTSAGVKKETKKELERFLSNTDKIKELDKFKKDTSVKLEEILKPSLTKMSELFGNEKNEVGLEKGNVAISSAIKPNISVSDSYITEVKDTESGINLPLNYNGLGYNNLINIYMLIKFSEIKKGIDFKILCLEEPEAHLHPAMQYKLFKYLSHLNKEKELNQQVFVTTHSSNISAVAGLDNMFMIQYDRTISPVDCCQQSLKEQFEDNQDNTNKSEAKRHLSKFLDVTRSDMLFADKVILVEGIAEKLLMPMFMEKCKIPYEDEYISIVEIGGKHFEYFIELFNGNAVKKKILCITDKDFKWINDEQFNTLANYNKHIADHIKKLRERFTFNEFNLVTQTQGGRTFEDELFLENFNVGEIADKLFSMALSENIMPFYIKNKFNIFDWDKNRESIDGRSKKLICKYIDAFKNRKDNESDNEQFYEKLVFSEIFLHYVKNRKGDVALKILTEKELFDEREKTKLIVPSYIKEGLEWLMK